jgi:hypothetical protein
MGIVADRRRIAAGEGVLQRLDAAGRIGAEALDDGRNEVRPARPL